MAFNLIQLETFRRLAREANFTRTAEALSITQPAVTQHVRGLEDHFRVKLVDLVGRKTMLTDAGRFLASRADALLGSVAALEREMREFADVRSGELRIGATVTIGTYALPDLVARFRAAYPGVALIVEVENTNAMARAVKLGRVSLALVEGPLADDEMDIEPYADDELVAIAPASHPFARRRGAIAIADLSGLPFVFREEGSGTRVQVEDALRDVGLVANIALTLPSGEGIVRAVELGIGIAIVSRLVADGPIAAKRVVRLKLREPSFRRTFRIVRLRSLTPSPAAVSFVKLLHDIR